MGQNDYFDAQERDAWAALRDERIDRRRTMEGRSLKSAADKIAELRLVMMDVINEDGDYVRRTPEETPCDLLRQILWLMTDGTMGDTWQGSPE